MKTFLASLLAVLFLSACGSPAELTPSEVAVAEDVAVMEDEVVIEEDVLVEFGETSLNAEEGEDIEIEEEKEMEDEVVTWNVHEVIEAGFRMCYPSVGLIAGDRIEVTAIEDLAGTMGFDLETAQLNEVNLSEGKYGEDVDFPLGISKKVRDLGEINAQEFMVLGRFEACDVKFLRTLYFFSEGHQVLVSMGLPVRDLIVSSPEYFRLDPENCGGKLIWNFEKQDAFYTALAEGKGAPIIQAKYDLFDEIVKTIEFSNSK